MERKNKVLFGSEAINALKIGVDIVYKAVSATMGASGKNTIYRSDYSRRPVTTNDGVKTARLINLEDEAQAMGADYVKQAAERTNEEAGDGTTTAVVLAHSMIEKGLQKVTEGVNPMKLRRQMVEATDNVIKKLKKLATPIKTDDELFNVANVSMENPKVAKLIVEAVKKAGENGTVIVEESSGIEIEKEDIEGFEFDRGYMSHFMVTNFEKMETVLEDVHILLTDKSFSTNNDMFHLLEGLLAKGVRKLLVICENVQGEMLATLIENKIRGAFTCVVVQKPFEPEMLEDIAALTGADTLVGAKLTGELNEGHILSLGKAKKVIVRKDKTIIIGGAGKKEKVEERMNALKGEMATTASDYRREGLRERVAKMAGSLVLIKVGAPTESDMKYMKDKVDDAVSATRAALAEGILPGGGRVLYDISHAKPKNDGEEVVFYACGQCIRKIIENSGEKVDDILALLKEGEVWDALDNKICADPMKSGLIDPAKVERCALKNAVSAAGLFITMGSVIVELPRKIVKEMV